MPTQQLRDLCLINWLADHLCHRRSNDARGTKSALQRVMLCKSPIQRRKGGMLAQSLDGRNLTALSRDRQKQATAHRDPIDQHGAGATHAMLTSYMRSRQAAFVA